MNQQNKNTLKASRTENQSGGGSICAANTFWDPRGSCRFQGNCVCTYKFEPKEGKCEKTARSGKSNQRQQKTTEKPQSNKCTLTNKKRALECEKPQSRPSFPPYEQYQQVSSIAKMPLAEFIQKSKFANTRACESSKSSEK